MGDEAPRRSGFSDTGSQRGQHRSAGSFVLTPPTGIPALPDVTSVPVPDDARGLMPDPRTAAACPAPLASACVCRHPSEAHEHWRPGTDCGICGAPQCSVYRRRGGAIRRLLRRLWLVR